MNYIWVDLLYALRATWRSLGATLAIIVMLALGTGGMTAVFNPIYSLIFAPLPFPQPEQLVRIGGDIPLFNSSFNRFERREELSRIFSNLAVYALSLGTSITLPDTGKNVVVCDVEVNEEFFETLGVLPLRGSDFRYSKERRAVVVSNRFWRNELMGTDDAVGKPLRLYGMQYSIIGIMPETFDFPAGADIWSYRGETKTFDRSTRQYLGRLQLEVSHSKAVEELISLDFKSGAGLLGNAGPAVQSLKMALYGDRRPMLLMLGSSAVLFLLLVCTGVMNILVAQGTRRKSEMAMRLIFGATRRNLVFQLLRETLPLVIIGTLVGAWLSEIASLWLIAQFPALQGGEVILPVKMVFVAALVLAVTIIGGLTPALYVTGVDLNTYLKSASNSKWRFAPFSFSLRELLVGVQLSLSLALLSGVGLLLNSLMFHVDVPISWSSMDMVAVHVKYFTGVAESPMVSKPAAPESQRKITSIEELQKIILESTTKQIEPTARRAMFFQEFQNSLRTMQEVANAGSFTPVPFSPEAVMRNQYRGKVYKTKYPVGGRRGEDAFYVEALYNLYTSPEGFDLLGIPLIAGRHFSQKDIDDALALYLEWLAQGKTDAGAYKAIINQSLARQLWPEENVGNAVGKIIYDGSTRSFEIIGVVRDFLLVSNNKNIVPALYQPESFANSQERISQEQMFIVKLYSGLLIKDFRQRLSNLDVEPSTIEINPLGEIVSESMADTRMTLQMFGIFALLGIVVAGLGAYATTSLMVTAMNREIGIRIAMGAQTCGIFMFVLWRGIRVILIVLPIGLFLAWILSRILSDFLFMIKVDDPLAWIISCTVLLGIMVITVLVPALRATHVNPLDAMRNE